MPTSRPSGLSCSSLPAVREVAEDVAAHRVGDLDGGGADAAAGGVHQDALARREPALGEQGVMSGDERLGDRRGFDEVEVGRNRHGQPLVGQDILGLTAAGHDAEDPIAGFERARSRPVPSHRPRRHIPAPGYRPARPAGPGTFRGLAAGRPGSVRRPAPGPAPDRPLGSGVGTSRISRTSGPPLPVMTMAFTGSSR